MELQYKYELSIYKKTGESRPTHVLGCHLSVNKISSIHPIKVAAKNIYLLSL